jgi:hypothetical protein
MNGVRRKKKKNLEGKGNEGILIDLRFAVSGQSDPLAVTQNQ